jgi:hypothetical protein
MNQSAEFAKDQVESLSCEVSRPSDTATRKRVGKKSCEGVGQVGGVVLRDGPNNCRFANVPLAPAHRQTVFCSFQNGGLRVTNRVVWQPTDALTAGQWINRSSCTDGPGWGRIRCCPRRTAAGTAADDCGAVAAVPAAAGCSPEERPGVLDPPPATTRAAAGTAEYLAYLQGQRPQTPSGLAAAAARMALSLVRASLALDNRAALPRPI